MIALSPCRYKILDFTGQKYIVYRSEEGPHISVQIILLLLKYYSMLPQSYQRIS